MPILFVGLLTLGLGIALLVQDAQRTGRRIAWQGAVGTILGMVLVVIGLGLIVIGFVLLVLIITAPIGIGLMLAGLLAVVLGIAIAGLSWLPWRKRGRPDVIDAEVIDD